MLILSCASKLQLLETLLKRNLPQTVAADTDNTDLYKNIYAAFYWDLDVYRRLLLDTDTVNWKQTFCLYGNQNGIYDVSKDAAAAKKIHLTATPHFTYLNPNPDKMPQRQLDSSFTISTLKSSHVDILNETWHYGGNEQSRRFLDNIVKCFPNICILDSNAHPISWGMTDPLGAQIHGYTLPSHRRRGYLAIVLRALSMKSHVAGCPVYGHAALNNVQMQRLLEYMGFQRLSELCHLCIHSSV
ncbi:glycine N-acyltransferase-like protein 3 isoform X4 [Podarcis raffonei]|uniref:glycine N-acyltransferase-like protein 3 isoform X4 n=1 Tax=Podarcis raffonei TaxID=65483 RepID=UPI0023293DC2|nr:glycine N-acyltransferase-like protein 3 isoform X4 [Podarcis raffonei]